MRPTKAAEIIREALETAMARIGCPPGDNADADIYRDLQHAIALLADMDSPVDVQEVIRAGEELIRCHRGFHEAIAQHTGKPYPWEPMEAALDQWTNTTKPFRP